MVNETMHAGVITDRLGEEDIARRFDYRNIFEDASRGFLIDIGTKALIFIDGLLVAICPAGRIDVNHLPELKKYLGKDCPVSLVLVRSGQIELGFLLKRLTTKDKVMVDFSVQFLVQLFDPSSFFFNAMVGRSAFCSGDLRRLLFDQTRKSCEVFLGGLDFKELSDYDDTITEMAKRLDQNLSLHLRTFGLHLNWVSAFDFSSPEIEREREHYSELFHKAEAINIATAETEMVVRLGGVKNTAELARQTMEIEHFIKKNELLVKLSDAEQSVKMEEIRSEQAMEDFLRSIDSENLLKQDEIDALKSDLEWKRQDRDGARRHFLAKLEIERSLERQRLKLKADKELSQIEQEQLIVLERAKREKQLLDGDTDLKLREKERGENEKDALLAQNNLAAVLRIELEEKAHEAELRRGERESQQKHELDKMKLSSELELKEQEALKDLSIEQILALKADKSAEIAKVFQEKAKSSALETKLKLTEDLLHLREKDHAKTNAVRPDDDEVK